VKAEDTEVFHGKKIKAHKKLIS